MYSLDDSLRFSAVSSSKKSQQELEMRKELQLLQLSLFLSIQLIDSAVY